MAGIAWDKHWRNRYLVWQLTKREIAGRYRGSTLGLVWSIVNPLMMLLVYTFVFSVVFKARWD
ncbi:ABC transporter permease, partial [Rhizobium johnstonii]